MVLTSEYSRRNSNRCVSFKNWHTSLLLALNPQTESISSFASKVPQLGSSKTRSSENTDFSPPWSLHLQDYIPKIILQDHKIYPIPKKNNEAYVGNHEPKQQINNLSNQQLGIKFLIMHNNNHQTSTLYHAHACKSHINLI